MSKTVCVKDAKKEAKKEGESIKTKINKENNRKERQQDKSPVSLFFSPFADKIIKIGNQ